MQCNRTFRTHCECIMYNLFNVKGKDGWKIFNWITFEKKKKKWDERFEFELSVFTFAKIECRHHFVYIVTALFPIENSVRTKKKRK